MAPIRVRPSFQFAFSALFLFALVTAPARAQQFGPEAYSGMRWRNIGPYRGGRTVAVAGIPTQPNVYYLGAVDGGVWKTINYGLTWTSLFNNGEAASIGAIAVAPEAPNIVYVGSGEGLLRPDLAIGDGMYKSTDAGATWTHLGLRESQQIASIIIDPHDPNRLFVAVLGHPYGPNEERGVFRSTDGGQSFQKVLYENENVGAIQVLFDPTDAQNVYAVMWASRHAPWSSGDPLAMVPGSGLYKSSDGGDTWQHIGTGLPTTEQGLGRIGIAIAPSDVRRMYAQVEAPPQYGGTYRSDDAGQTWRRVNHENRVYGRGSDFAEIEVAPSNPDELYVANTSMYHSMDAGVTWTAFKGSPSGDDYHRIWINPLNPSILLIGVDKGAVVSVDGGKTWSSWFNQPTGQMFHVITDNQFPYRVYGSQQDAGSVGILSRGNDGDILFRDWHPVGVDEYDYIAPDPLHPNLIYGGKVTVYDWATGQVRNVEPEVLRSGKYHTNRTAPLIFSPADPHVLFFGENVLFKTIDGGDHWSIISPDLSRPDPGVPANMGPFGANQKGIDHRGVIYGIGPSFHDVNTIWVGTDEGQIQLTRDGGKTWKNVTPPQMTSWSKVSQIVASHFDENTAYASVSRFRLDDLKPYIYRTHDGGKTWKLIVDGIAADAAVNVVREDSVRKGLLIAGTERAVWFSVDDGDHWQSLQLNLPHTSMRDLVIHDDDVVLGTHGRAFWILDDITPLRQLSEQVVQSSTFLFRPGTAYRVERNTNPDTPLPPEIPAGENPPDGAILDYYLQSSSSGPVTLAIYDAMGKLVRRYASTDKPPAPDPELNMPTYWILPPQILSSDAGMHRFVWDLHYPTPAVLTRRYPFSAVLHETPLGPFGPDVLPGVYTVKLTVDGHTYSQPLTVKMDPRVKTTLAGLRQQFDLSMEVYRELDQDYVALQEVRATRSQLERLSGQASQGGVTDGIAALQKKLTALEGRSNGGFGGGAAVLAAPNRENLTVLNRELEALLTNLSGGDMGNMAAVAPTSQAISAVEMMKPRLTAALAHWTELKNKDVAALNAQLRQANLPPLEVSSPDAGASR